MFLNAAHTHNGASVEHVALQQPPLSRLQIPSSKILQGSCDDGPHPLFTAAVLQRLLGELLSLARQLLNLENKAAQCWSVLMVNNSGQRGNGCRFHVEHKQLRQLNVHAA